MILVTMVFVMMTALLALLNWRQGLAMCILIGIAQDPLRKLAPNQPVYYVVLVGLVFGATWIRAALVGVPLTPGAISGWRSRLQAPFSFFLFLVVVQGLHSYARYRSAYMTGIGLLVWLAPVPAIMLSYQFALRQGVYGVRRWMLLYIAVALVALSGVYLEYAGFTWRTLGEIGTGQILYDLGTVLKAHSGFFRASEIAAWHTAAIACFVFILSIGKRATLLRIVTALALIAVLVTLGMLTGRRKMLMEILVFLCTYAFLVAWLQRGMARLAMIVLAMGVVGYVGVVGFVAPDLVQRSYSKSISVENAHKLEGYAARGQSVFADLPARVNALGVQPIMWAIDNHGWLGAGLGTGSQGTNEIAEANNIDRGASEGGLGKVTMELGVPGLFAMVWLVIALTRHILAQLAITTSYSVQHSRVGYGLLAFLVANAATFSIATQAYSDLFILLIMGWCLGFLLAMPVLAARGDNSRHAPRKAQRQPMGYPGALPQAFSQTQPGPQ